MKRLFTLLVLLALVTLAQAEASTARRRAVRPGGFPAGPGDRILWIAAHPDDETVIAPLLGPLCVEAGAKCSFLVLTRGEGGICKLPGGCAPGLGTVRSAEMQRSASLFGASLMQWELSDVMSFVGDVWAEESGGRAALVARIEDVIERERPALVLTFDPRHGTTCHPAHRTAGELVVEAMAELTENRPPLLFLETAVAFESDGFRFSNAVAASSSSVAFGAGVEWRYLVDVARIHGSQFTNSEVEALARTPHAQRWVFLAPAGGSRDYLITCP